MPAAGRVGSETARGVALAALVAVDGGARANEVVPAMLDRSSLQRRDRALVTELVYGACRMQRACDWLVDRHVRGRTDPPVRAALRVGAYQLGWLRTPRHAAVAATVEEVSGPGRSVVNAVLRRVADDLAAGPTRWPDPATALSYPDWVVARLAGDLGAGPARRALEVMNEPAEVHERADGYIQDPASQMVAAHVGGRAGERVLDLCAAPGGKATAVAGCLPAPGDTAATGGGAAGGGAATGGGAAGGWAATGGAAAGGWAATGGGAAGGPVVVAADLVPARAAVVAANAARLGLDNVAVVVADGLRPPLAPGSFDRVLVDAPCSGLGVLRRRPDARWRVRPGDVTRLAGLQRGLVAAAAGLVAPGGRLFYSVCTLTRAETVDLDRWAAGHLPGWVPLAPPADPWTPLGRGGLLLPQAAGTDGMYLLSLRRPG